MYKYIYNINKRLSQICYIIKQLFCNENTVSYKARRSLTGNSQRSQSSQFISTRSHC